MRAISTIRRSGSGAGRELLVVDRARGRHVQAAPAGVAQPPGEVDLVGVDEEVGVEVADLRRPPRADEQRRGLAPVDLARALAAALHGQRGGAASSAPASAVSGRREAPRARPAARRRGAAAARRRSAARGSLSSACAQRERRAGQQLGVLVEQQREAPARAPQQLAVVGALPRRSLERDHLVDRRVRRAPPPPSRRASRCRARAPRSRTAAPRARARSRRARAAAARAARC